MQSTTTDLMSLLSKSPDFESSGRMYFADPGQACPEALLPLLEKAARECGATELVGPLAGNTFYRYRTVIEDSGALPFLCEPYNSNWSGLVDCLEQRGYRQLATYASKSVPLTEAPQLFAEKPAPVEFESFRVEAFEEELSAIYELTEKAFAANFLYSAISKEAFISLYEPLKATMDGELVLMARASATGKLVGFCLALRDTRAPRLILKTIARDPDPAYRHLGLSMVCRMLELGRAKNFQEAIFALYKEGGFSSYMPDLFGGKTIRRYAVYARELSS